MSHSVALNKANVGLVCFFAYPKVAEHFAFVAEKGHAIFPFGCYIGIGFHYPFLQYKQATLNGFFKIQIKLIVVFYGHFIYSFLIW